MRYADFLGFLFPQHELMKKEGGKLEISPHIVLDACHATSVPPYMRKMGDIVREHTRFLGLVGKPADLKCVYGLQNPPENATSSDLDSLSFLGIRFMTLAYECENEYGGGFATPDAPLTERGMKLLDHMAEARMVLDLSHAGHQTARDALKYISNQAVKTKVVATHTACHVLFNHGRNLPDDVLLGIRKQGGLVGLVTMSWMLHESDDTIWPFLFHLNHLVNLIGEDNVCLGTDGVYHRLDPQEEQARYEMMKDKLDPRGNFRTRYPMEPVELNRPDRMSVIQDKLLNIDCPKELIRKVMGENLISFLSTL